MGWRFFFERFTMKLKFFTLYVLACVGIGLLAKSRGRSGIGWALIALITTPLLAGGVLLLIRQGQGQKGFWF
jgi:hypothetical protein